jgi:hypothetical protein
MGSHEIPRITVWESGAVGIDIRDERILNDPRLALVMQKVDEAAQVLRAIKRGPR